MCQDIKVKFKLISQTKIEMFHLAVNISLTLIIFIFDNSDY